MESVGDFEYNTKDLIGHGAFAVVFKGRHKQKHDQVVAIKSVAKKNLAKSQNLLGKEIKILQEVTELHHKNVVALLNCKETPQHVYLVMEYCNGGDLAEYLNNKGTLSEDTIRLFLRQIAEAMKALNAKEVVHRDLKPQNILLCHSGKPNPSPSEITLKIADFGFARFLQDGVMAATLCGSPMYMAPEVIMSLQYDAKADLWSIGTIVFQCLTGKAPFQAQTPQALKQYYEKNANLAPRIPSGTSKELTDLLLKLLKRNAKDRMDFDDFFNHTFLQAVPRMSSPVPVPSRRSSPPETTTTSPLTQYSPSPQCWDREVGGEDMAQSPSPLSPSPLHSSKTSITRDHSSSPSPVEQGFVMIPPSLPEDVKCNDQVKNVGTLKRQISYGNGSPSKIPVISTASRKSGENININLVTGGAAYQLMRISPEESSRPTSLPVVTPNALISTTATTFSYQSTEAIPVPSQRDAYEKIQRSLQNTPSSSPQEDDFMKKLVSLESSPASPKEPSIPRSEPIAMRRDSSNSLNNEVGRIADISSLSPPAVQFTIGTPPSGGRLRSYSGSTPPPSSGRQTPTNWRQQMTPPPTSICGSPLRRSGTTPPYTSCVPISAASNSLSPVVGSPSKEFWRGEQFRCQTEPTLSAVRALDYRNVNTSPCPLRVAFGGRTMTLPEFSTKDLWPSGTIRESDDHESFLQRSGSSGRLSDQGLLRNQIAFGSGGSMSQSPPTAALMPYSQQQHFSQHHCHHQCWKCGQSSPGRSRRNSTGTGICLEFSPTNPSYFPFGTSPSNTEGAFMFIPNELPEETLLEKEHNETLAKLNFVLALVECILELAKVRSSPLSALTDSLSRKENLDQAMSEGCRRAEQLVLYMRALQLLSSSLQLSRQEVQAGRLQPSTSVRNVLHSMKNHYHFCLSMCKTLNTPGILQAAGVDPTSSNITADKLLYNYAIEMCQSAALEELFGNPQECFRRYQTAQILLHSLGQQVKEERDKKLLNKYQNAVERRLYVLYSQGYACVYDTT